MQFPLSALQFRGTKESRNSEARKEGMHLLSDIRLEGRSQFTASDGKNRHHFKSLVWDTNQKQFVERVDIYNTAHGWTDCYERPVFHSRMLSDDYVAGAIVDQVNQRIILPNGQWIEGPTGDIYTVQNTVVVKRSGPLEKNEKTL